MSILWLGDERCGDAAMVGGKAANLSRLAESHPVPPGFVLATSAPPVGAGNLARDVVDDLTQAYRRLGRLCGSDAPAVAVRSSAVDEDGESASFAGQHDTFLNVSGVGDLLSSVERCIGSYTGARAAAYRAAHGLCQAPQRVAVLVQCLVVADVSAVVFTSNPVTGDRSEVVINASWGLGESLVDGTVTPDALTLRKSDCAVTHRCPGAKRRMTVAVGGGTKEVEVPGFLRAQPALSDSQAIELAHLGLRLEETMGRPVDVECALRFDRVFLLQCRAITTAAASAA